MSPGSGEFVDQSIVSWSTVRELEVRRYVISRTAPLMAVPHTLYTYCEMLWAETFFKRQQFLILCCHTKRKESSY